MKHQHQYDIDFRPNTFGELCGMSREHMVAIMDGLQPRSPGGLDLNDPKFWYAAIQSHDQAVLSKRVMRLTIWIAIMTAVYTIATLVMVGRMFQ